MRWIRSGITREVFLVGQYAIKVPSFRTWRHFVQGILCNLNERTWWQLTRDERLCPVLFSIPGGFLIVMRRADALAPAGEYAESFGMLTRERIQERLENLIGFPVEPKPDSLGVLDGRIVAIDYGDDMNIEDL